MADRHQDETRTLVPFRGVVLPPPEDVRDYAPGLQQWAQERPCESFLEALIRRLGFGSQEKLELFAGLREIIMIRPGIDLLSQADRFSEASRGSLGMLVTVRGLHQLMFHRPKPGNLPAEIEENIATMRAVEAMLAESAPNSSGYKYIKRYRRSLVRRELIPAQDSEDSRLSKPSLAAVTDGMSALDSFAPEAETIPPFDPTPVAEPPVVEPPAPAPPDIGEMMGDAARQASKKVAKAKADAANARPPVDRTKLIYALAAVAAVAAIVQLSVMGFGSKQSTPADITELPVVSMTRYARSVTVRVDPAWMGKSAAERSKEARALFVRLAKESEEPLRSVQLQNTDFAEVGTVTPKAVTWVSM